MADEGQKPRKTTRRDFVRAATATGVGGLVLGAAGGFGAGRGTAAGGGGAAAGGGGADLRVVLAAPMTGTGASWGRESKNGALMAIDEINANGGVLGRKLKYVEVDQGDWNDPTNVRQVFSRIVDTEKPDVIIAPAVNAMGPDLDVVAEAGILYFHATTREDWRTIYKKDPEKYWSIFQCDPAENAYGQGVGLFFDRLAESGEWTPSNGKTVAIAAGADPGGTEIAKRFRQKATELGWEIVSHDTIPTGQVTDWGPVLSKVRRDAPSVFFTSDFFPPDNAALAKQWAAAPIPALIYQHYAPSDPEFKKLAGAAGNGIIWSTVLGLQVDDIGNSFRDRYRKLYKTEPGWSYAGGVYDEVKVWAHCAALSGDPKDYRRVAKVVEQTPVRGVTGVLYLKDHINAAYPVEQPDASLGQPQIIAQVKDDGHTVIYPEPYTNGKFVLPPWMKKA
ncbi:MAG: branched-chain amino acid transport system substrate-binding protein [Actinomycetota bacterium]|jgi:branched-chain amino acid transport system substrate-binding protein|nr:branched-chain amino acid transport system substrate-binding protein [Actinomycetota bacterium]